MASGFSFEIWWVLAVFNPWPGFVVINLVKFKLLPFSSLGMSFFSLFGPLECLWWPLLLPVQTHQLNEFMCCAHAKEGSHPKVPAGLVPDIRIAVSCFWQDSRSGCVWFLLLLMIKNKTCCWGNGVLSKRNWGTIMISWDGKFVNWSTIAAQLPFLLK